MSAAPRPGRRLLTCGACRRTSLGVPGPCPCGGRAEPGHGAPPGHEPPRPRAATPRGVPNPRRVPGPGLSRTATVAVAALVALAAVGVTFHDRLPALPFTGGETASVAPVATPHARPTSRRVYRTRVAEFCRVAVQESARVDGAVRGDMLRGIEAQAASFARMRSRFAGITRPPAYETLHAVIAASFDREAKATAAWRASINTQGMTNAGSIAWLSEMRRDQMVQAAAFRALGVSRCGVASQKHRAGGADPAGVA